MGRALHYNDIVLNFKRDAIACVQIKLLSYRFRDGGLVLAG
jgi:hypothetical protein